MLCCAVLCCAVPAVKCDKEACTAVLLRCMQYQAPPSTPPATSAGHGRAALGAACCGAAAALAASTSPAAARQLFVEAWCLHELLLRRLSLAERARQLPPSPPAAAVGAGGLTWPKRGLTACLEAFHSTAAALLSGSEGSSGGGSSGAGGESASAAAELAACPSMADWLDGRLLHIIALALWQGRQVAALPAEEQAQLAALRQAVQQAVAACSGSIAEPAWMSMSVPGPQLSRVPAAPPSAPLPAQPPPNAAADPAPQQEQAQPLHSNALVAAICKGGSGPSALLPRAAGSISAGSTPYAADYHWHSGNCPVVASLLLVLGMRTSVQARCG